MTLSIVEARRDLATAKDHLQLVEGNFSAAGPQDGKGKLPSKYEPRLQKARTSALISANKALNAAQRRYEQVVRNTPPPEVTLEMKGKKLVITDKSTGKQIPFHEYKLMLAGQIDKAKADGNNTGLLSMVENQLDLLKAAAGSAWRGDQQGFSRANGQFKYGQSATDFAMGRTNQTRQFLLAKLDPLTERNKRAITTTA